MIPSNLAPLVRVFDKYSYKTAAHNKWIIINNFISGMTDVKIDESKEDFDDLKGVLSDG
jgi:hypothetical protein